MAYLLSKICVVLLIASLAIAQIPSPDASWSDYKIKACCPTGYYQMGNYCVKCTAPLFFDAISGKCNSCPTGHFYNPTSNRCECQVPCAAPRVINATTKACECPVDSKGTVLTFVNNKCQCPAKLPLWNGKYCVVCPVGTTFDQKQQQCYHCPDGFVRDLNTHTCVPNL